MTSSQYAADCPPTVVRLEIGPHFSALNAQQKRYAHHLSRAAFIGTRITLAQVSPESVPIYDLIVELHKACRGDYAKLAEGVGVEHEETQRWVEYAAQFLGNCGNYKGFGDSKFVPRVEADTLQKICGVNEKCKRAYEKVTQSGGGLYVTHKPGMMHLGYPDAGHMSAYYPDSEDITKEEIAAVGDLLEENKLLIENTRLRKTKNGDFELLIASGVQNPPAKDRDLGETGELEMAGKLKGRKVKLVFGDYQEEMAKIAVEMRKAEKEALNETEQKMTNEYAKSFGTGSIEAFKESQRFWIKDQKPMVETNIGFIETYRDPHGVRGEWEGFVAMVNLERTKAFGKLVEAASSFIPRLPWSTDFEKDTFLSPDFTSLEVLTFSGSGIPAGINVSLLLPVNTCRSASRFGVSSLDTFPVCAVVQHTRPAFPLFELSCPTQTGTSPDKKTDSQLRRYSTKPRLQERLTGQCPLSQSTKGTDPFHPRAGRPALSRL